MGSFGLNDRPPCDRCKELPSVLHCDEQGALCNRCVERWNMGLRNMATTRALAARKERLEHCKAAVRMILLWRLASKVQGPVFRDTVRAIDSWESITESSRQLKMVEAQRGAGGG